MGWGLGSVLLRSTMAIPSQHNVDWIYVKAMLHVCVVPCRCAERCRHCSYCRYNHDPQHIIGNSKHAVKSFDKPCKSM